MQERDEKRGPYQVRKVKSKKPSKPSKACIKAARALVRDEQFEALMQLMNANTARLEAIEKTLSAYVNLLRVGDANFQADEGEG